MITFSSLGKYGRLGNQLFQYSILKSVSNKTGFEIVLDKDINTFTWHGQKCLLKNFSLKSANYGKSTARNRYSENTNDLILSPKIYDENVYKVSDDTNFFGYFQSPKYYEDIKDILRDELEMDSQYEDFSDEYLNQFQNTTVSLHVRRGDVSDGTNRGCEWANDFTPNSIQYQYYKNSLDSIPQDSTILLFTGGNRENKNNKDYEWCKNNFKDERIVFVNDMNELETISIMKKVNINITGFKSTFSWWGSFLNKNENVIAPKNFNPSISYSDNLEVYPSYFKLL